MRSVPTNRLDAYSYIWTDVKRGDEILIYWEDPQAQSGWASVKESESFKVASCKTYGQFISYNDDVLVIAQTEGTDGKDLEYNNLQSINSGCIRSIHSLSRGAKQRKL